jgi:hypothetical protein
MSSPTWREYLDKHGVVSRGEAPLAERRAFGMQIPLNPNQA